MIDHADHVRSLPNGLERQKITHDSEYVLSSLPRRNHILDSIGEQHDANAIVVADRGHRDDSGKLARQLALESLDSAEALRPREVYCKHHGQLALLNVSLYERASHSRRYVPIDRAHFITGLVFSHLGEFHSLAFENA